MTEPLSIDGAPLAQNKIRAGINIAGHVTAGKAWQKQRDCRARQSHVLDVYRVERGCES